MSEGIPQNAGYLAAAYVLVPLIVLALHHLERLAQEHPGIGILREPLGGVLRGGDRAPPIFDGAPQPHQRRVTFPEHGAQSAAHPQPPVGAPGRVALAGGGSPHGEPHKRGAQGPEHCLIMDLGPERLQPRMASQPRRHPLAGRRIVVTRAREQAGELARALEALGAEVLAVPTIRIVPLADLTALRTALTGPTAYDWIVFTSQNTVHVVCDRLPEWGLAAGDLARMAVAAIGPATAQALVRYGVTPDLVPPQYVGEALLSAVVARGPVYGKRLPVRRDRRARDSRPV